MRHFKLFVCLSFLCLCCHLQILLKTSFKTIFRNTMISVSNDFDPDQARHSVGPDLGPNCNDYQQMNTRKEIVNVFSDTYYGNYCLDFTTATTKQQNEEYHMGLLVAKPVFGYQT